MDAGSLSTATVGRLPGYLQVLAAIADEGATMVSSEALAASVGANSATVRRDLSSLGFAGTRGVGYDVKGLVHAISVALGVNQEWPVVVIGAGNLGRALANYGGLADRGFPVRAICDVDQAMVGTTTGSLTIDHIDNLASVVARETIRVGVIATSADAAQTVADQLVAAGVGSVLNFTSYPIEVPDGVVVRRVDLATELQILSFYQQRSLAAAHGTGIPLPADDQTGTEITGGEDQGVEPEMIRRTPSA